MAMEHFSGLSNEYAAFVRLKWLQWQEELRLYLTQFLGRIMLHHTTFAGSKSNVKNWMPSNKTGSVSIENLCSYK